MSIRATLPPGETKCIADPADCRRTQHCARHEVSSAGRPVADYTKANLWIASLCAGYVQITPAQPQDTRRVHPPLGSH